MNPDPDEDDFAAAGVGAPAPDDTQAPFAADTAPATAVKLPPDVPDCFGTGQPQWDKHALTPGMWQDDPEVVNLDDFSPGQMRRFHFLGQFEQQAEDHETRVGRPSTADELSGFADIAKAGAIRAVPFTADEQAMMNGGDSAVAANDAKAQTLSDPRAPATDAAPVAEAADGTTGAQVLSDTAAPTADSTPAAATATDTPQEAAPPSPAPLPRDATITPTQDQAEAASDESPKGLWDDIADGFKKFFGISTAEAADTSGAGHPSTKSQEQILADAAKNGDKRIHFPGAKNCVALVRDAVPDLGPTGSWKPGIQITADKPNIAPGTAIATFNTNGKYVPITGQGHTAIFQKYGTENGVEGIYVVDQAGAYEARRTFIPFNREPGTGTYTAGQFHVIN